MKLSNSEKRYAFVSGDEIIIPKACYIVFFSPDGRVIHPEFKAVMKIPILPLEEG